MLDDDERARAAEALLEAAGQAAPHLERMAADLGDPECPTR